MTVILFVDDDFGMTFFGKRQSRDSAAINKISEYAQGRELLISPFSASLFEQSGKAKADNHFLDNAGPDDICLAENSDITPYLSKTDRIILYRWNRKYPSDFKFDRNILKNYRLTDSYDFCGTSHDKITVEVYDK